MIRFPAPAARSSEKLPYKSSLHSTPVGRDAGLLMSLDLTMMASERPKPKQRARLITSYPCPTNSRPRGARTCLTVAKGAKSCPPAAVHSGSPTRLPRAHSICSGVSRNLIAVRLELDRHSENRAPVGALFPDPDAAVTVDRPARPFLDTRPPARFCASLWGRFAIG